MLRSFDTDPRLAAALLSASLVGAAAVTGCAAGESVDPSKVPKQPSTSAQNQTPGATPEQTPGTINYIQEWMVSSPKTETAIASVLGLPAGAALPACAATETSSEAGCTWQTADHSVKLTSTLGFGNNHWDAFAKSLEGDSQEAKAKAKLYGRAFTIGEGIVAYSYSSPEASEIRFFLNGGETMVVLESTASPQSAMPAPGRDVLEPTARTLADNYLY